MSVELAATITTRREPTPRHADPLAPAALCAACPKLCATTCPVQASTGREAAAPWRISATVRERRWTSERLHQVSSCTGCGACSRACLAGVTLPDESRAARADAAGAGVLLPAAERLRARVASTGHPRALDRAGEELGGWGRAGAPTVLLHGCAVQRLRPSSGRAALAVARATGADVRTLAAPEPCCGAASLDLGLVDEARALAERASAALAGAGRVVPLAPSCARVVRDVWPRWGLAAPTVLTAPEWLAEVAALLPALGRDDELVWLRTPFHAQWRKSSPGIDAAVAWHAPCTLARGLDVVDAPLEVLRRLGIDVREPAATGMATRCSGAGMAYPQVDPAGAAAVAADRSAQLAALGARVVVTACPGAATALGARDLVELVAARLGVG